MSEDNTKKIKVIVNELGASKYGIKAGEHFTEKRSAALKVVFGENARIMMREQWEDRFSTYDSGIVDADTGELVGFLGYVTETYLCVGSALPDDVAACVLDSLNVPVQTFHRHRTLN